MLAELSAATCCNPFLKEQFVIWVLFEHETHFQLQKLTIIRGPSPTTIAEVV